MAQASATFGSPSPKSTPAPHVSTSVTASRASPSYPISPTTIAPNFCCASGSADVENHPAANLSGEYLRRQAHHIQQWAMHRHFGQLLTVEVARQPIPRTHPLLLWRHHAVDTRERDTAQNERCNRTQ
ncbi:protein of unknown function [Hyphomicrobium sp. 1Nfss2.1]